VLFESLDIGRTVRRIEGRYSSSGRGRPRYPVRAMLLALMLMHLLQIPSVSMLSIQLCRHEEYRVLSGFGGRAPDQRLPNSIKRTRLIYDLIFVFYLIFSLDREIRNGEGNYRYLARAATYGLLSVTTAILTV
jgi:hypothetical protein